MNNIYIKKIVAKGKDKRDSIVEFSNKLSIIYGASNTGKTYIFKIINYLFGSSNLDIKTNTGYNEFDMVLSIDNKDVSISRCFKSTDIFVKSNHDLIKSGQCSTDLESPNPINSLYLLLLGIEDEIKIPFNKNCEMKRFTFRSFIHMLMINEVEIERPTSLILPKENTSKTYFLSALLLLLYEQDFSSYDPEEKDNIKRAKKSAIKGYINKKISEIELKMKSIQENSALLNGNIDVYETINNLTFELNTVQNKINEAISNGKKLLISINKINESLTECDILLNRYKALESQYMSDIKRLSFIVESTTIMGDNPTDNTCPFCNNHFKEKLPETNIESINGEIIRIKNQLNDLKESKEDVLNEKQSSLVRITEYKNQYKDLELEANETLKKKEIDIKDKLNAFHEYVKLSTELNSMVSMTSTWNDDLADLDKKQEHKTIYKPMELFSTSFENEITAIIKDILKSCNLPKYETAHFNIKSFDIEINGDKKNANGKGFTAFYNTILVLAFRKYLYDKAAIKPFFFVIDTPLLGLDVGKTEFNPSNIRKGVYQYFLNSMEQGQLIIFDNEKDLPKMDFNVDNLKMEYFSHQDDETTRYGFLLDYED